MTVTGGWEKCVRIQIPEGMTSSVKGCDYRYDADILILDLPEEKKAQVRFSTL
jgi:hypothetical protein